MKTSITIHSIIASATNVSLMVVLLYRTFSINSDKAPLLVLFYYPLLPLANLLAWLALRKTKPNYSVIYRQVFIALVLLFIPGVYLAYKF